MNKDSRQISGCLYIKVKDYFATASLSALPTLKAATREAGMAISSLVLGLRPTRAARSLLGNGLKNGVDSLFADLLGSADLLRNSGCEFCFIHVYSSCSMNGREKY